MEYEVKKNLEEFEIKQSIINMLFDKIFDNIKEELHDQDEINETVTNLLTIMTERINDIESRLNKLEKEKRRNATNK